MTKKKVDNTKYIIVASLLTLAIFIFIYLFINYYIYGNANNAIWSAYVNHPQYYIWSAYYPSPVPQQQCNALNCPPNPPELPILYMTNGNVYEFVNFANLSYGCISIVYNTTSSTINGTTTYNIYKAVPPNQGIKIIEAYRTKFGNLNPPCQLYYTLSQINDNSNNLSTLLTGAITELHLWGYINGQPEYDVNMNYTYIAITPHEQELGFMNQTSYGYGNMLFLFNNDTSHCFWDKNTGTNLTLYWIDWKNQRINYGTSGSFLISNTKLGTITAITHLTAYNTTPECVVSDAVMESTSPQILDANDFISIIYKGTK